MAGDEHGTRLRVDRDGVRIERSGVRSSVWLVLLAVLIIGAAVVTLRPGAESSREQLAQEPNDNPGRHAQPVRPQPKPMPGQAGARATVPTAAVHDAPPTPPNRSDVAAGAAATPGAAAPAMAGDENTPDAPEAPMFGPVTPGEPSGIALFPPPGTKPIKRGILVPEDFELPPGYVRHYQATDDGERVPAILMFHPDYQPVDEQGVPIPLPANRVVPPEMAPPGLPIQMLELPEGQGEQEAAP